MEKEFLELELETLAKSVDMEERVLPQIGFEYLIVIESDVTGSIVVEKDDKQYEITDMVKLSLTGRDCLDFISDKNNKDYLKEFNELYPDGNKYVNLIKYLAAVCDIDNTDIIDYFYNRIEDVIHHNYLCGKYHILFKDAAEEKQDDLSLPRVTLYQE